MKILGIETSCDETAAAVVENGTNVLSNVIASQIDLHRDTGGVVPEVAAREHVRQIIPVIEEALEKSGCALKDIDAIAVTQGPGLLSSLIIGVTAASTLAFTSGKILIPVNHIAGHIYANWLGSGPKSKSSRHREFTSDSHTIQFPLVVLTVSGGHNELVLMREQVDFQVLGETLDDAAGEAFDKVARILGLGYPGGPEISRVALEGNANRFSFPKSYMGDSFDFSFSGLKTAVFNVVKAEYEHNGKLSEQFVADCSASFQESVCEILSDKLLMAAQQYEVKEIHLAGGVSANQRLRWMVQQKILGGYFFNSKGKKITLTIKPSLRFTHEIVYCTDNAAMIAAAAFFHHQKNPQHYAKYQNILANPNLELQPQVLKIPHSSLEI